MGVALILIGLVIALLVNWTIGLIIIVVGVILLFVPHTYGYSDWRGRRGPPA
jgi:4-hydroxybenzoate polyprenyltransferase